MKNLLANMSDRHHHGRMTSGIRFSTEDRIIYKPRGLQLDVAFLDSVGDGVRTPEVLTRAD